MIFSPKNMLLKLRSPSDKFPQGYKIVICFILAIIFTLIALYPRIKSFTITYVLTHYLPTPTNNQSNLKFQLENYTDLLSIVIASSVLDSPSLEAGKSSLDNASIKLSQMLGVARGEGTQTEYLKLLRSYNLAFTTYAGAPDDQSSDTRTNAISLISGYPSEFTNLLKDMPTKDSSLDLLKISYREYSSTIKTLSDSVIAKDYQGSMRARSKALEQCDTLSRLLAPYFNK